MKIGRFYIVVFLAFTFCLRITACPFTIVNNGSTPLIVVDPNGLSAVYIEPGKSQIIDPTLYSLWRFISHEKLDFYIQSDDNTFYKKYRVVEAYCLATADNRVTFSDVEKLVKEPTDWLTVIAYAKPIYLEHQDHVH